MKRIKTTASAFALDLSETVGSGAALAQKKPKILVTFGDDIGMWNVGAISCTAPGELAFHRAEFAADARDPASFEHGQNPATARSATKSP